MSVYVDRPNFTYMTFGASKDLRREASVPPYPALLAFPSPPLVTLASGATASKRSAVSTTFIDLHIIKYGLNGSILAIVSKRLELFKTIAVDTDGPDD